MPAKSAPVHSFFTDGKCMHCTYKPSKSTGATSLETHLLKQHPLAYQELLTLKQSQSSASSAPSLSNPPANKKRKQQLSLYESMKTAGNKSLNTTIAIKMACLGLPLQLVDRPEFHDLVAALRSSTDPLPTRKTLRL